MAVNAWAAQTAPHSGHSHTGRDKQSLAHCASCSAAVTTESTQPSTSLVPSSIISSLSQENSGSSPNVLEITPAELLNAAPTEVPRGLPTGTVPVTAVYSEVAANKLRWRESKEVWSC